MDKAGNAVVRAKYKRSKREMTTTLTLAAFSAEKEGEEIILTWLAGRGGKAHSFEIEHSMTGKDWNHICSEIANEENQVVLEYIFAHDSPAAGINSYRIKMIGRDGSFMYSPVKDVNFEKSNITFLDPDSSTGAVNFLVDIADDISSLGGLHIVDTTGNVVLSPEMTSGCVDVDALKNGFYVLQILKMNGRAASSAVGI